MLDHPQKLKPFLRYRRDGCQLLIAYLNGGRQFHALHKELVDFGKMKNREFHDWIYKENRMSVEMMRALLTNRTLTRDFKSSWRFLPAQ